MACKTLDATYHFKISGTRVVATVDFPKNMIFGNGIGCALDKKTAILIENELHNSLEKIIFKHYKYFRDEYVKLKRHEIKKRLRKTSEFEEKPEAAT